MVLKLKIQLKPLPNLLCFGVLILINRIILLLYVLCMRLVSPFDLENYSQTVKRNEVRRVLLDKRIAPGLRIQLSGIAPACQEQGSEFNS